METETNLLSGIGERIERILLSDSDLAKPDGGLNFYAAEKKTGINRSTLQAVVAGKYEPKLETVIRIHRFMPEYSIAYIITGHSENKPTQETAPVVDFSTNTHKANIYLMPVLAQAGQFLGQSDLDYESFDSGYLPWLGRGPFTLWRLHGVCMQGFANHGDMVLCKKHQPLSDANFGSPYIIVHRGGVEFKYLRKSTDNNFVELHCENPDYEPKLVKAQDVFFVFENIEVWGAGSPNFGRLSQSAIGIAKSGLTSIEKVVAVNERFASMIFTADKLPERATN